MKKVNKLFYGALIATALYSCGEEKKQIEETPQDETPQEINDSTSFALQSGDIKLTPLTDSPKFESAELSVESPTSDGSKFFMNDQNEIAEFGNEELVVQFNVNNYELKSQTSDADGKGLANSGMGQHIHVIVDNNPYMAQYVDKIEFKGDKKLEDGNHTMLAFLSRSYHESVKAEGAYAFHKFKVGETDPEESPFDEYGEHMFYSRPKGSYHAADAKKILLDFFLLNTSLSPSGNYVELTVNQEDPIKITKWQPYIIEGMPYGKNKITLTLKNAEGDIIESLYNPVTREIELFEEPKEK